MTKKKQSDEPEHVEGLVRVQIGEVGPKGIVIDGAVLEAGMLIDMRPEDVEQHRSRGVPLLDVSE